MAVPNYLGFAQQPGALQTAIGTMGTVQQQRAQRQTMQQQAALAPVKLQQAQETVREQPLAFAQQQKGQELSHNMLAHQIAVEKITEDQAKQKYMHLALTDLAYLKGPERNAQYQQLVQRGRKLGFQEGELPDKLTPGVEQMINQFAQNSPTAKNERAFQQKLILAKLAGKYKIGAELAKTGATQPPPGSQLVGGGTSYIVGGQQPPPGQQPQLGGQSQQGQQPQAGQQPQPGQQPQRETPIKIIPTPVAQTAYAKQQAQDFSKAQTTASNNINTIQSGIQDIDTFMSAAAKIPTGTGPFAGHLAWSSPEGQLAIKSQNRLALNLLATQKFGRVTNKEMGIVQQGTLNTKMNPQAWHTLGPQLKIIAQRNIAYSNFLNDAANLGIRSLPQATKIWNKFVNEKPIINADETVNRENAGNYQKYLSPKALRGELESSVFVPKGFKYPGE